MEKKNTRPDRGEVGLEDLIDLCSEGEQGDNRQPKRRRETRQASKTEDQILDLCASSPEGVGPSGAEASSRRLWGEAEQAPPRWSQARRRSALCHPTDFLDAMAVAPDLPPGFHEPGGLRLSGEEGQGEGRDMGDPHPFWGTSRRVRFDHQPQEARRQPPQPLPQLRPRLDAALARRMQAQEERAARLEAQAVARRAEEEDLMQRMDRLEELEALEESLCGQPEPGWMPPPHTAAHHRSRGRPTSQMRPPPQPRARHGYPESLAEAMMGMLSEGTTFGGSLGHLGAMSDHLSAVRRAMSSLGGGPGRLPAHLMYSDRDFGADDYEMLLALDDNVASRKGASAEQIDAIPTVLVGEPGGEVEKDCRCLICLEDLEAGACLRKMVCKHHFHKACLDKWLAQKSTCPICQQSLGL